MNSEQKEAMRLVNMNSEQQKEAMRLLKAHLPPRLHNLSFKHGRGTGRYWITITTKGWDKYDSDYWKGITEGLLIGMGLVSVYLGDTGPQDCYSATIHWDLK